MRFNKFKLLTKNSNEINYLQMYNCYKTMKIVSIINYYSLEVIIYNNNSLNRWIFILNDINVLDNKLTKDIRYKLKSKLSELVEVFMDFEVTDFKNGIIYGRIYKNDIMSNSQTINKCKTSINSIIFDKTIHFIRFNEDNINATLKYNEKYIKSNSYGNINNNINKYKHLLPTIDEE